MAARKAPTDRSKPVSAAPTDSLPPNPPVAKKRKMSWGELKIRYRRREGDDAWGGGE